MRRASRAGWLLLAPLALAAAAGAQSPLSAHTLGLDEGAEPGRAVIADVAWLAGAWRGEGLGGEVEEVWSAPAAGAMMGAFRLIRDGRVAFYEILTISEESGSLVLRLKHFDALLRGWEEKDETVDFPLVRVEADVIYFDRLTIRRDGEDGFVAHLAMVRDDGVREAAFRYRRAAF